MGAHEGGPHPDSGLQEGSFRKVELVPNPVGRVGCRVCDREGWGEAGKAKQERSRRTLWAKVRNLGFIL